MHCYINNATLMKYEITAIILVRICLPWNICIEVRFDLM